MVNLFANPDKWHVFEMIPSTARGDGIQCFSAKDMSDKFVIVVGELSVDHSQIKESSSQLSGVMGRAQVQTLLEQLELWLIMHQ